MLCFRIMPDAWIHYSQIATESTNKALLQRRRWEERFKSGGGTNAPFRSRTFDNIYISQDGAGYDRLREPTGVHRPGVDALPTVVARADKFYPG